MHVVAAPIAYSPSKHAGFEEPSLLGHLYPGGQGSQESFPPLEKYPGSQGSTMSLLWCKRKHSELTEISFLLNQLQKIINHQINLTASKFAATLT